MNFSEIVRKTLEDKTDESILEVFIGKNFNRSCFSVNNKIFFDIFHSYLPKNSWNIKKQYISKKFYINDFVLETILTKEESNYLGLAIPFKHTKFLFRKDLETIRKFKGTYYDLFYSYYNKKKLDFSSTIDFTETYNETIEETTIFHKAGALFELHLIVESLGSSSEKESSTGIPSSKEKSHGDSKGEKSYIVKLVFNNIPNYDILDDLVDIIDLAMSKYKKTDKTMNSIFNLI